jgi:hypothetical protein
MSALPDSVVLGRSGTDYTHDKQGNILLLDEDGLEFVLAENYEVLEWAKDVVRSRFGADASLGDITLWGRVMYGELVWAEDEDLD